MHGAIAEAGQIRKERIWTTEGRPEGRDTWKYPAIQPEVERFISMDSSFSRKDARVAKGAIPA
jgi:hypothetical protein